MQSIFTITAPKANISFIKVGEYNKYRPSPLDFEIIRNLVVEENLTTEEVSKLLLVTNVKDFEYKISQDDYVLVFFCEYELTESVKADWIKVLRDAVIHYNEQPNNYFAVFHSPDIYDIKKIKKSLLPFL